VTLTPTDPDAPFLPRTAADVREAHRLLALGLARPVLLRPAAVLAGVHVRPAPTLRALAAAAVLGGAPGDDAALAFRTAAWVHAGGEEPQVLEVATPFGVHRALPDAARLRRLALPPADVAVLAGVRVTTPARTAADLARDLSPRHALAWLDRLRERAEITPADVVRQLDMMPTARRVAPARRLVRAWAAG
jgi:hypothetical protein